MQFIFIVFIPRSPTPLRSTPLHTYPTFQSLSLFLDSTEFYGHSIKPTPDNLSLYT